MKIHSEASAIHILPLFFYLFNSIIDDNLMVLDQFGV